MLSFNLTSRRIFRINDPEYKWFKRVCLSDAAHFMLKEYAQKHNVGFLSSPF